MFKTEIGRQFENILPTGICDLKACWSYYIVMDKGDNVSFLRK